MRIFTVMSPLIVNFLRQAFEAGHARCRADDCYITDEEGPDFDTWLTINAPNCDRNNYAYEKRLRQRMEQAWQAGIEHGQNPQGSPDTITFQQWYQQHGAI